VRRPVRVQYKQLEKEPTKDLFEAKISRSLAGVSLGVMGGADGAARRGASSEEERERRTTGPTLPCVLASRLPFLRKFRGVLLVRNLCDHHFLRRARVTRTRHADSSPKLLAALFVIDQH